MHGFNWNILKYLGVDTGGRRSIWGLYRPLIVKWYLRT